LTKFLLAVLVAACHTDLGSSNEAASGYYARPWNWDKIAGNANWIIQFHSTDDPFIPIEEARFVAHSLKSEYHEKEGYSHFFEPFDELVEVIKNKLE
jgi:predicted alpha/beta hydrolase family esterase